MHVVYGQGGEGKASELAVFFLGSDFHDALTSNKCVGWEGKGELTLLSREVEMNCAVYMRLDSTTPPARAGGRAICCASAGDFGCKELLNA
jgi:hypothetical protein